MTVRPYLHYISDSQTVDRNREWSARKAQEDAKKFQILLQCYCWTKYNSYDFFIYVFFVFQNESQKISQLLNRVVNHKSLGNVSQGRVSELTLKPILLT